MGLSKSDLEAHNQILIAEKDELSKELKGIKLKYQYIYNSHDERLGTSLPIKPIDAINALCHHYYHVSPHPNKHKTGHKQFYYPNLRNEIVDRRVVISIKTGQELQKKEPQVVIKVRGNTYEVPLSEITDDYEEAVAILAHKMVDNIKKVVDKHKKDEKQSA